MKKYLSCLLVLLALVLPMLGMEADAAETVASGTCGKNVTWTLDSEGTLTISGSGAIYGYDFTWQRYAPWYFYREDIVSVVLEEGITSIGFGAFYKCTRLRSITIPESLTSIGDYAFDFCNLSTVKITDIGAWCQIDFGNSSSNPLYYAQNGLYLHGELVTDVVIPEGVTSIGNFAFSGCTSLTSIMIPDSVTTIGSHAFYDCDSLSSITLPDSVTSIGGAAFYNCTSLSSITIPDSVASIGNYAFRGCTSLSSVEIGNGVTTIGYEAFYSCDNLSSVVIGNGVTTIGDRAFYDCNSLSSITIPDSVTSIGDRAFDYCDSLSSITIPDSVTSIGDYAFHSCDSLSSITIPDSVTTISNGTFCSCDSLSSITIPDSVTSIGEYAFSYCTSLSSITIPDSVTTIGEDAFYDCDSLSSVVIGNGVTSIGDYAFYNCTNLESITIPDGVTSIGDYVFYNCTNLSTVEITDIGAWCQINFGDSYSNPLIYADNGLYLNGELVTNLVLPDSVTSISDYAFYDCDSLSSITLPDSVTTIGSYAFRDCHSLSSVVIGNSVTTIGDHAFYNCDSLSKVEITDIAAWCGINFVNSSSNPLRYADNGLYLNGELVTNLVLPDSVTSISDYAFYGCDSLSSITIPDSVTSIGYNAFYYCDSVTDVYYGGTESQWKSLSNRPDADWIHYNCVSGEEHWTDQIIPESCFADGASFVGCSCGYRKNETVIPAIGKHNHVPAVTPPTCTEDGYTTYTCAVCGDTYTDDLVTMLGHNMGDWFTTEEPTCTKEGAKRKNCSRCDHFETGVIPVIDHSHSAVVTPPTCTVAGFTTYTCACGNTYTADPVGKLGHDMGAWLTAEQPTCTEEGSQRRDCTRCDHFETDAIPVLDHEMGAWFTVEEATFLEDDLERRECCNCDYYEEREVEFDSSNCDFYLEGYVGESFSVEVTSAYDYGYLLIGENSENVSVTLYNMSTIVTDSTVSYCKGYRLVFSQPGYYKFTFVQMITGDTLNIVADISAEKPMENPFEDVFEEDYYYDPVLWAVDEGITNGMDATHFAPAGTCTRAQIVTFLWRANGSPASGGTNPFTDVPADAWYTDAVLWAVEEGITTGTSATTFSPDAGCTRGQVATFLWRSQGQPYSYGENIFDDIAPGAYYYDAVLWAVEEGITNGMGEGLFAPDATCTRGQIVTFLYRAMK